MDNNQKIAVKKPILVLHGWGGSKQSWQGCLSFLDRQKYELFVPDLPGFGTSLPPATAWNLDDYITHIKQIMREYKLEKPNVIAHSFGARIAIKMASQESDIFAELFLVGAAGIKHKPSLKIRIFRLISKTGKWFMKLCHLHKLEAKARTLLYKAARTSDYLKAEGTMKDTFQKVIDEDLTNNLDKIKTKTHIIWGAKDSYVPVSDAHLMHEKIANSTLDVFAQGTHGLHLQMPEKLAQTIDKYLSI